MGCVLWWWERKLVTSGRKKAAEGPHSDELDSEIVWLLYVHGRGAVTESVKRLSKEKPGAESKYLPIVIEEIDIQIEKLLSLQSKIKIPTRNSIKDQAIKRLGLPDDGALQTGLVRCLKDKKGYIFARIDILGSHRNFPHIRFLAVLDKYVSQKDLGEVDRKFAESRIACVNQARANYQQWCGELPADDWSLARIEGAVRQPKGAFTLLAEQLAAEKSEVGSH